MLWNISSVPQLSTFSEDQKEGSDQIAPGFTAAVQFLLCLLSLTASNISCVALVSFFLTTLPTKRNLLTFFELVIVVAFTCAVDIAVKITRF